MNPEQRGGSQPTAPDSERITRREFLGLAGGLVVLFGLGTVEEGLAAAAAGPASQQDLSAWLAIGPDSRVSVFIPAAEVGQGIRTSLAQMVAEELSVPLSSMDMIMGDTARVPHIPELGPGPTLATVGMRVREAAARAREIVAEMAAGKWGVPREAVALRDGMAVLSEDPTTAIPLGELARGRRLVCRLDRPALLKPPADYQVVGEPALLADGRAFVTGEAKFVADLRLPDMLYGKVLRPVCCGARLLSAETTPAARLPGVVAVVAQGDFIAVVATTPDLAEKALRHIHATWEEPDHHAMASLSEELRKTAELQSRVKEQGDVQAALASARHGFSASYRTPFLAHAPLEPHGAVAVPQDRGLLVYASTQRPFAHRDAVAQALGLPADRVRVMMPPVGGAFGGKDDPRPSVEAARLARAVGRPVMLSYSREEEFTCNYFGPAALIDVRSGVSAAGDIIAWDCDVFNCGPRGALPPYQFPNQRIRCYRCDSPLPQGHWRGMGGPANTFARESHLDHIAGERHQDPIALRLRHLEPDSRLAGTIQTAAERYGWSAKPPPTGLGVGFACAEDSGTCVAQIAEVEVVRTSGEVRLRRVLTVCEPGLVVNPDGLRSQIEGAVIMGLGLALREMVRYEQGRILNARFASYPIPAFPDLPQLETILITNPGQPPGGGGTPAIFPVAAAISNAVFDAVGKRIPDLPLSPDRVLAALRQEV